MENIREEDGRYGIVNPLKIKFDFQNGGVRVSDCAGYFPLISLTDWNKYVNRPFSVMAKVRNTTKIKVVKIYLAEISYQYICLN